MITIGIYVLVLALERYYQCIVNTDMIIYSCKYYERIKQVASDRYRIITSYTPIERLQRAVSKVITILRIKKVTKYANMVDEIKNPLIYRLYLSQSLWIFSCILVFIVFPICGNNDSRSNYVYDKILCNDIYAENVLKMSMGKCNTIWKNEPIYSIFYLLNILYLYYSAIQLRYGYHQMRDTVLNKNWKSSISYGLFQLYESLPLLREINTTIEFAAANTSLTYMEWLKMDDIRGAMIQSKYQAERREDKNVGGVIKGMVKVIIGISTVIIVVFIIVSPLLLFSELNPSSKTDHILYGNMDVSIIFDKYGNYSLLNNVNLITSREGLHSKQRLEFNDIMDSSVPFTPESIRSLDYLLNKSTHNRSSSVYIKIDIRIKTALQDKIAFWSNNEKVKSKESEYNLVNNPGLTNALRNSLSTTCEKDGLISKVYIGSIYSVCSI